jgi:pimeloyl-ACP methyl ester carboxylesterase
VLDTGGAKLIETVPKRGYRFAGDVSEIQDEPAEVLIHEHTRSTIVIQEEINEDMTWPTSEKRPAVIDLPSSSARELSPALRYELERPPETMYARSGDVNIAYQVIGDAPLDLVFVMGWVSHLEYFWREPSFARFLLRLASFARLILFDKRGTGLSDRVPINELPTLEQRMDDVRAVMDAVGSERAALCGVSEGGPMCSLFAATYPEKTAALVMIGTYAKRIRDDDYPWAPTTEHRQEFFDEIRENWGGPVGLEERAPSVAGDPEFRQWWATYLRMGASPGAALALTQMNAEIDVRSVLPSIRVPTLVIHRKEDQCLKVEEGRYVAERIPGARYVELPGRDHLPFVGDQDSILDEVEEFLTGVRHTIEPDRVLATVLFMHVVDSQEQPQRIGDTQWLKLLDRLRAYARKEIEWFRGRDVDMDGDRPLAIFDGPARAIRCAIAISEYASRLGTIMRAGLHTGECDIIDGQVRGIAAEIGAKVSKKSAPNEVLVSSTVKDLVAGSGIRFEERGAHRLAGVPGEWQLFAVERGLKR